MSRPYLLSFCQSDEGIYYTNRNFLIIQGNETNIQEFERLRKEGTEFDGKNDCALSNFNLEPQKND